MDHAPEIETQAAPRRVPAVGDHDVLFQGHAAVIIAVKEPTNPDSPVDIVHTDQGVRRIASGVRRSLAPGCWAFVGDVEAARPRSPLELWAIAKAAGELVPEVGSRVIFAHKPYIDVGIHQVIPRRAVVTAVFSVDEVALDVFEEAPPADPEQPERLTERRARCLRATAANDHVAKGGYFSHWDWPGGLIKAVGPVPSWTIWPAAKCDHCREMVKVVFPVQVGDLSPINPPLGSVCEDCRALLKSRLSPDSGESAADEVASEIERRLDLLVGATI